MQIISVSRRTDIPAFYSDWFMGRIRAGYCHWVNPFGGQVYRVSLLPEDCIAFMFMSRDPKPLIPHLALLSEMGYRFYFHMTVNGYPRSIETANPDLPDALDSFKRISDMISPEFIKWRYDPILISNITPPDYHLRRFKEIGEQLRGYTGSCYISFMQFYGKTERNLGYLEKSAGIAAARPVDVEKRQMAVQLAEIASDLNITMYSCCSDYLIGGGIKKGHCVDYETLRNLRPDLSISLKASPTREGCGCLQSTDIGAFDTCLHGCAYCYATNSLSAAGKRYRAHDPEDSILWRPASLAGVELSAVEKPLAKQIETDRPRLF
jgi:hypothetical protein